MVQSMHLSREHVVIPSASDLLDSDLMDSDLMISDLKDSERRGSELMHSDLMDLLPTNASFVNDV